MSSSQNIINSKPCIYNCNTRIYWNTSENAYFEIFSGNKHQCPNRQQSNYNKKAASSSPQQTIANKSSYYSTNNKKSYYSNNQSKPKMSNSLELLQGSIAGIQRKYEILSDIVSEANGKVHGSQSHIVAPDNTLQLIVYYEVPEGKREEVKRKFSNSIVTILNK